MKSTKYYINLNYICNEHCVFCASDLTHNFRFPGHRPWVTLADVQEWVGEKPPGPQDRVCIAGGEPTLHKELFPIARFLSRNCSDVIIFTNGLRFVDPEFAKEAVVSGIKRFEIGIFGSTAETHDAITQVPGSFEKSLLGLKNLCELGCNYDIYIEVRLLVSQQSSPENARIVQLLHDRALTVDGVSINRLILSNKAKAVDAAISYDRTRNSINLTAQLVRKYDYELIFRSLPLCVFEGDNAVFVLEEMKRKAVRIAAGLEPSEWEMRYLDPVVTAGQESKSTSLTRRALPPPCMECDYRADCARVERWYLERFGALGLQTVHLEDSLRSTPARPL